MGLTGILMALMLAAQGGGMYMDYRRQKKEAGMAGQARAEGLKAASQQATLVSDELRSSQGNIARMSQEQRAREEQARARAPYDALLMGLIQRSLGMGGPMGAQEFEAERSGYVPGTPGPMNLLM